MKHQFAGWKEAPPPGRLPVKRAASAAVVAAWVMLATAERGGRWCLLDFAGGRPVGPDLLLGGPRSAVDANRSAVLGELDRHGPLPEAALQTHPLVGFGEDRGRQGCCVRFLQGVELLPGLRVGTSCMLCSQRDASWNVSKEWDGGQRPFRPPSTRGLLPPKSSKENSFSKEKSISDTFDYSQLVGSTSLASISERD